MGYKPCFNVFYIHFCLPWPANFLSMHITYGRNLLTLLLTGGISIAVSAQAQPKQFTMAQATNGMRQELAPEKLRQFEWVPGQQAYTRALTAHNKQYWIRYTLPAMKADTLLQLDQLNQQLFSNAPLPVLPQLHWLSATEVWFSKGSTYYTGTLKGNSLQWNTWCKLPDDAENIFIDKTSRNIAWTQQNNVYLRLGNGEIKTITTDGSADIVNGQSVHRDEFGIDHGIFFSPSGNQLAFYRMDQQMVADYPITDWSVTPAKANNIKYPMAGRTSHQVTLGVYNPATGKTTFMQTGMPADQYLTCVTWSPDEQSVYIGLLNRAQNQLKLNQYDARSGAFIKTLLEEKSEKYVHPMHSLTFLPWAKDQFIWWSEKDGFDHLYLYNTSGQQIRQLTSGSWLVNEIAGFNEKQQSVIYTSTEVSPAEKHIYTVDTRTGRKQQLTTAAGWHDAVTNGTYVMDAWSAAQTPYTARLTDVSGKWQQTLLIATDPLLGFNRPIVRPLQLKAADGTPLYGKLILPVDFDSTKKYPVIVYLYNGPGIQLIKNTFPASGNLWYEYMAQRGYMVFTMDGRGSSNRGLAFEQSTWRHLGTVEMEDQLQGVAYLRSLPYTDTARMGVHGWSFGGFMTTSLMLRHPGIFKAAVAGGPVIDWHMYEVMYTERYMSSPQDNKAGYDEASLLTKTPALKGNLMLIHGTSDDVVVWQHSIDFIRECVNNGKQVDYFVYPGHLHNVLGKDRVHLMQKITDYFISHL